MPADVLTRAAPAPDLMLRYGPGEEHVADVRFARGVAAADAPAPLVIFLHGGFWRSAFDRTHTGPLAAALAAEGFTVCAPEFRRTGQAGGGWPGTFDDVAAAVDTLPTLVAQASGGLVRAASPVVLAGHSAGGHLALWAAGRGGIPSNSAWRTSGAPTGGVTAARQSNVAGVVALAAVSQLAECHNQHLGHDAAAELMGGGPGEQPGRYRAVDPVQLLPLGCPIRLVHGSMDDRVPVAMSRGFAGLARAAGDDARLDEAPAADHFDIIDPVSGAWPRVLSAFRAVAEPGAMAVR